LAVHLALAFIKYHNLKIAIIDTDPQGNLGKWFMIRTEKNIPNKNLTFKTASLWGAQYESKSLKKDHDIIIIDTPPKIESDARPAIEAADLVLIPVAAESYKAPTVIVNYTSEENMKSGKKFADLGVQIATGMPLEIGEPSDFMSFRIGLFGIDKLLNIDRTVENFKLALEKIH